MEITIPSFTLTITNFAFIAISGIYIAASIWIVFWKIMSGSYSILDTPNLGNKKYFIIFFPGWIFWTIIFGSLSLVMITYQKLAKKISNQKRQTHKVCLYFFIYSASTK